MSASWRIALLRAVNVGGIKLLMSDLRAFAEALALAEPKTLLQSGNLVFRSDVAPAELEAMLERECQVRLGLKTAFLVRSGEEWAEAVAANPLRAAAEAAPSGFLVLALKTAPAAGRLEALRAAIPGPEQVEVVGRHAYIAFPDGMGRSKLSTALLDRKLGTGTGRNWNTTLKLLAMTR